MSDQESDDEQRRDKLLLRLLKMPPQSRAELAEASDARRRKSSLLAFVGSAPADGNLRHDDD